MSPRCSASWPPSGNCAWSSFSPHPASSVDGPMISRTAYTQLGNDEIASATGFQGGFAFPESEGITMLTNSPHITFGLAICLAVLCAPSISLGQGKRLPDFGELKPQLEMPDPLVMLNGHRVKNSIQWTKERRPELKLLFQHFMYGYFPPPVKVMPKIGREASALPGGKANLPEITLRPRDEIALAIHPLLVVS